VAFDAAHRRGSLRPDIVNSTIIAATMNGSFHLRFILPPQCEVLCRPQRSELLSQSRLPGWRDAL
jgi:hypothetical protein